MPITSTNSFILATVQQIVIDCSVAHMKNSDQELSDLLRWVQSVRMRSSIHVTLRFSTGSITGRKIRSKLQSLGCKVSMQTHFK